jgi:Protein of unknown function (DUF3383)
VISQSRYIKIVSGVGAGAVVAQRQLLMRVITQNAALPPGLVAEFANAESVGAYFGTSSEEYKRASAYFSFISKSITSPPRISFSRWVATAIAPMVVGDTNEKLLASFSIITAGTLSLQVGSTRADITALDFSAAADLTAVAAVVQTAIRTSQEPQLATATVTFNTNTNQFVLTGSAPGSGTITAISTGLGTDVSDELGWTTGGTINVKGQGPQTAAESIGASADISNNFGSFVFATPAVPMTNDDIKAVAEWTDLQNNLFLYSLSTPLSNLQTLFALIKGYSGTAINILSTTQANDYIEQSPCEILAATDYDAPNSSQNYMFYQFPKRTITVSDDNTANTVDKSRGNYIGVTQSAGQQIAFYQRGILCGGSQAAVDMNTFANEMWLKAAFTAAFFSLFVNVPEVPANPVGEAMLLGVMNPVITQAKINGVISAGKDINAVQQQYITQISGDPNAWRQVQTLGYWLNISFSSRTNPDNGLTEWIAKYQFIYSKSDAIRAVIGSDVMI